MDGCSWIESVFQKRECVRIIPSTKDPTKCCCGYPIAYHNDSKDEELCGDRIDAHWSPSRHTEATPTNAYGTIDFQGGAHPNKAQYIRLAHDTRPELVLQLLTQEWRLDAPKLLISVHGGRQNFDLSSKVKKVLRRGLLKAAKTTGAWIISGGTNTGVTRHLGDALTSERSPRLRPGRVVSIGMAPWGIIHNRIALETLREDVPYHSIAQPKSRFAVLNSRLSYFLLVDNGTVGKYGAEIAFRKRMEKYISNQRIHKRERCGVPMVCVVIEGGPNTIRSVLGYVTESPPVPVVLCHGTGRAADLLAITYKFASESEDGSISLRVKEMLLESVRNAFDMQLEPAEKLVTELQQCVRRRDLITVFRVGTSHEGDSGSPELDIAVLRALLKGQHLCPSEQLCLALSWNRVDIARSEIFVYGQEWLPGDLEEAMMDALVLDRLDFVKLLLENGVSMSKFLTIQRLEDLYNTSEGPTNTLRYLVRDIRHVSPGYKYTLIDIGLVINKLMGGAFRSTYSRRSFRQLYEKSRKKKGTYWKVANQIKCTYSYPVTKNMFAEEEDLDDEESTFRYPFSELMIWGVLTKRHHMSLLMWQHGEEAVAKALVSCRLLKAMAHEAADDDLETEIYEDFRSNAKDFEKMALDVMDCCYRQDDDLAQHVLTYELNNWGKYTCLGLAVLANHRALIAHPCSQILLADMWMGGLRTRRNTNFKILLGLIIPPYLFSLEFRTQKELQEMPQTEEEYEEFAGSTLSCSSRTSSSSSTATVPSTKHTRQQSIDPAAETISLGKSQSGSKRSINDLDKTKENGVLLNCEEGVDPDTVEPKKEEELRPRVKLYEFYNSPITKFWFHSLGYMAFLALYTYCVLVHMDPKAPSWQECYVIAFIYSLAAEKFRQIICAEPPKLWSKVAVWAEVKWNVCDAVIIVLFSIAVGLRFSSEKHEEGRVMYCTLIIYFYIRLLDILSVNKYLGPFVMMIGKMVLQMIQFVVLLLVVLMSFGIARESIINPSTSSEWQWISLRNVFLEPYFMLYGEVYAGSIDPVCSNEPGAQYPCRTGRWITPAIMSAYLLVANILLLNLLIAVFNNIFQEVNGISTQVWMFQRFRVVMEYEQKPVLPPPLIIFSYIWVLLKYIKRKIRGKDHAYDHGLKRFLDKYELERVHDFEEECVEELFKEKEQNKQISVEERVRSMAERSESLSQKMDDVLSKSGSQQLALQQMEYRLGILEELANNMVFLSENMAVIHRFMATHMESREGTPLDTPPVPPPPLERRRSSTDTYHKRLDRQRHFSRESHTSNKEKSIHDGPSIEGDSRPWRSSLRRNTVEKPSPSRVSFVEDEDPNEQERNRHRSISSTASKPWRCRHTSEVSNPELAIKKESELLRNAEVSDYQLMEGLIKRRLHRDSENLNASLEDLYSIRTDSSERIFDGGEEEGCDGEDEGKSNQAGLQWSELVSRRAQSCNSLFLPHSGFPRRVLSYQKLEHSDEGSPKHEPCVATRSHHLQTPIDESPAANDEDDDDLRETCC